MAFQDMAHIYRLRDALWQNAPFGNAVVMVGAGFSRNADQASISSRAMPSWSDMAYSMVDQLYSKEHQPDQWNNARKEAGATSGFLRLAQEYEAAFGRTALNERIRNLVPDNDYVPGEMHKLLLELPWADVLTTNWDTLLERAAPNIYNRNYQLIPCQSEIPNSRKPRIIKLHGSFPAHTPFIFTEEDYRTYPDHFAPLVNLVRQSMMENVLCLVGFSGDDPNFLHWSGWVRDQLSRLTQKIYLVGWLSLSTHRRRMLEERHVVPIDLAQLSEGVNWPHGVRHQRAVEWFLKELALGKRPLPYDWPIHRDEQKVPPLLQRTVPSLPSRLMAEELHAPLSVEAKERADNVRAMLKIWAYNRVRYPGWLVAPDPVRQNVWLNTQDWVREIIHHLPVWPPWEGLFALEELVWRLDVVMAPLTKEVFEAIANTLDTINVRSQTCTDGKGNTVSWDEPDWERARHCWRELCLAQARSAREDAHPYRALRFFARLEPFQTDDSEFNHRFTHERCLLTLRWLDHAKLNQLLDTWDTDLGDPVWRVRKAAILAEINRTDEALALLREAIKSLRMNMRRDTVDLPSLSREGWTLFFLIAFQLNYQQEDSLVPHERNENIYQRLRELAVHHCDASANFQNLQRQLEKDPPWFGSIVKDEQGAELKNERMFDLGVYRTSRNFRSRSFDQLPAYQMKRLTEVAGLPPRVKNVLVAHRGLERSMLWLADEWTELSIGLGLRLANRYDDESFKQIFTRHGIARLERSMVDQLVTGVQRLAGYVYLRCASPDRMKNIYWIIRLRVAVELLSRLAPRLSVEQLHPLLERACHYYQSDLFAREIWLHEELKNLFKRVLDALPPAERYQHIPRLVALPIPSASQLREHGGKTWLDPFVDLWPITPPHPQPMELSGFLAKPVDELLSAMGEPSPRGWAATRLEKLRELGLLSSEQQKRFANALWNNEFLQENGLPGSTLFYDWAFVNLPEPTAGEAERRFRAAYLTGDTNLVNRDHLVQLGKAFRNANHIGQPFHLSDDEKIFIVSRFQAWINPINFGSISGDLEAARDDFKAIADLLTRITLPQETAGLLNGKSQYFIPDLKSVRFLFFPALLKVRPGALEEISMELTRALASDKEPLARGAMEGLHQWMMASRDENAAIPPPPDEVVREIATIISVRRRATLYAALGLAFWIFEKGLDATKTLIAKGCLHGLNAMLEEARYDRSERDTPFDDIPLLRFKCVQLALAMSRQGWADHPTINKWLTMAKDDPLPEVRNALLDREIPVSAISPA